LTQAYYICNYTHMYTSEVFRALGDSTRLRCFRALAAAGVPLSVAELTDILQKPQYAISRALAELRKHQILTETREGKLVFYTLDTRHPEILTLAHWLVGNCQCEDTDQRLSKNPDGSSQPGADACVYDDERLRWRLKLRELIPGIITYRPRSIGGIGGPMEGADTENKLRVLFVCVHNSARSQLAEAFLRLHGSAWFTSESAGIEPGTINPYVAKELSTRGIDITEKLPQGVAEVFQEAKTFDWIITVCDPESEKLCPVFPGPVKKLSWPFPDPSRFSGSPEQIQQQIHDLAVHIEHKILDFLTAYQSSSIALANNRGFSKGTFERTSNT